MTLAIEMSQTYRVEKGGGWKSGNAQEGAVGLVSKLSTESPVGTFGVVFVGARG
jgi:hypothetical protein